MKTYLICVFMLLSIPAVRTVTTVSTPDTYPIAIRVTSEHWKAWLSPNYSDAVLRLKVVIDGKKYTLQSESVRYWHTLPSLMTLGRYPARIVREHHASDKEYSVEYALKMPDGTSRKFVVIGESE